MKKIIILMLLLSGIIYSNSLNKINTLQAKISEKTFVNKGSKEKVYSFTMKYPDKAYKEMISPKLNQGEKYIYNGNKKKVYYPLLEDSYIEDIDEDENYILQAIKAIKEGKKSFVEENGEIKEFNLNSEIKLVFSDYKTIDGLNFPSKIVIFENRTILSQLIFSDVKINKSIDEKLFIIK